MKHQKLKITEIQKMIDNNEDINISNLKEGYETLLMRAVRDDLVDVAKLLIDNGADVNSRDHYGNSLLSITSNIKIIKLLVNNKVDVNIADNEGISPLAKCAFHIDKAQLLIDNNAHINNALDGIAYCFRYNGYNLAYNIDSLVFDDDTGVQSIEYDTKLIQLLVDNSPDVNFTDSNGDTLLHKILNIENNHNKNDFNFAQILIDNDADINIQNNQKDSILSHYFKPIAVNNPFESDSSLAYPEINSIKNEEEKDKKERTQNVIKEANILELHKLLIESNSKIDLKDEKGMKKLMITFNNFNFTNLNNLILLLRNNFDYYTKVIERKSIISYLYPTHIPIIKALINDGVNVNVIIIGQEQEETLYENAKLYADEELISLIENTPTFIKSNNKPQELVKILTNFTIDTPIKFTTHEWRARVEKKYINNFDLFIGDITEQFKSIEEQLKQISPKLHKKIYNFLISKEVSKESWCSKGDIFIGWSSLDGLKEWIDAGNEPFDFQLENSITIEDKTITIFGEVIELFKNEIEIRENMLQEIFTTHKKKLGRKFKINISDNLQKEKFYTDVESFSQSINEIFQEIKKYAEINESYSIDIELSKPNTKYIELYIIHNNSISARNGEDLLKRMESKGDSVELHKLLKNLCDWNIEAESKEDSFKIDCFNKTIDILNTPPRGYTHIMRFYK